MRFDYDYSYLVFNMEKQHFYVQMLNVLFLSDPINLVQEDQVFGLFEFKRKVNGKKRYDLWNELRSLKFKKDGYFVGCLVETKDKWKINKRKFHDKDCRYYKKVTNIIINFSGLE